MDKSDLFVDERVVVEELFVNAFEEIAVGREEIFGRAHGVRHSCDEPKSSRSCGRPQ